VPLSLYWVGLGVNMNLIKQPNNYSCTLTAVAMLLNVTLEKLVKLVGHNGSEIIFPNLPDPLGRKGVHIQEIIDVLDDLGYSLIPIEFEPWQTPNGVDEHRIRLPDKRFYNHLIGNPGLIVGQAKKHWHTVAWDGYLVYDPNGTIYKFHDIKIDVQTFWKIKSF